MDSGGVRCQRLKIWAPNAPICERTPGLTLKEVLLLKDDIIVGLELVGLFREEFGEMAGRKLRLGMQSMNR